LVSREKTEEQLLELAALQSRHSTTYALIDLYVA
jgi:hypothetical protein